MKIIHLLDSPTWNGEAEYALRCALAVRCFAGCEPVFVTDSGSAVSSTLAHHRFRVEKMALHGLMKLFSVSKIGNLLRDNDSGEKAILHLHSPALLNTAAGALQVAGQGRAALVASSGGLGADHPTGQLAARCNTIVSPWASHTPGDSAIYVGSACRCVSRPAPIESDVLQVLYAGTIDSQSGLDPVIDSLCRAAANGPRLRLTVAGQGEGRYVMPMVRKARALTGAVTIDMAGPQAMTDEFLQRYHLMVVPSGANGFNAETAKTAMAHGLGIVRPDTPWFSELGPCATVEEPDGWADTLARLAADRAAVETLRRQSLAHATASWSDVEQFGRTLCGIYSKA